MKPDYVIEVKNIGQPLANSITILTVRDFYDLFKKRNSSFRIWFMENMNRIESWLAKSNKEIIQNVENYFNPNFKDIVQTINDTTFLNSKTIENPKLSYQRQNLIEVQAGGSSLKSITIFCYAIVLYLFPFHNGALPVSKRQTGGMMYDTMTFAYGCHGHDTYLKITPKKSSYEYEFKIYHEILKHLQLNNGNTDCVVKILSEDYEVVHDKSNETFRFSGIVINGNIYSTEIDKTHEKYQKISEFVSKTPGGCRFIMTEHDKLYTILYNYKDQTTVTGHVWQKSEYPALTASESQSIMISTISTLSKLNQEIGFNHWDFHANNLLVHQIDRHKIKIFDFDFSSTIKNPNSAAVSGEYMLVGRLTDHDFGSPSYIEYGLAWDILKFMDFWSVQEILEITKLPISIIQNNGSQELNNFIMLLQRLDVMKIGNKPLRYIVFLLTSKENDNDDTTVCYKLIAEMAKNI